MATSSRIFRFFYTSTYSLLYVILLGLLLITPADAIERSIRHRQTYNIWLLIVSYAATILLVMFIYSVRLYVNKTVLAAIPKNWVPIELGDVNKHVHKMINAGLDRSAAIAYEARPREDDSLGLGPVKAEELGISRTLQGSIWDGIEHRGWASPKSQDLPNLQYVTVLSELPNLVEAKAMTLAPSNTTPQAEPPVLDPEAVALLQRPANLSLRGYLDHLSSLGVLDPDENTTAFLQRYELARFSTRPISNAQFREMMHLFAEILRSMVPLDLSILDLDTDPSISDQGDLDTQPVTPLSRSPTISTQDSQTSVRRPLHRDPSWQTAPITQQSHHIMTRQSSSSNSFAQTRHPYQLSASSSSVSSASLRSGGSSSVIRLSTREDGEALPYVLNLRGTAETFEARR